MPRFATSDGLSLFYEDEGRGRPLLCLPGLTRDSRDFRYLLPHLPPDVRAIRMDFRGRGRSDRAEDYMTYTVAIEARDVLELMDHLGLERAAILGTSRGGLVAMTLSALAKDRLTGIALNDIGPEIATGGLEVIMGYLGRRPVWKTLDEAAAARPTVMAGFADVPAARWREEVGAFYTETPQGLEISYDARLRDAVVASAEGAPPDLWPLFDAMEGLPLAILRGANSDLLLPETLAEMRRRRPDAIVAEVPDRGHVPFLDEPEAIDALTLWLDRIK